MLLIADAMRDSPNNPVVWLLAVLLFLRGHRGSASISPQQES